MRVRQISKERKLDKLDEVPVDITAYTIGDIRQSIDSGALAAAALEILHCALVVHQHRHHLVGLRDDFVECDIPSVVVDIVHNLKYKSRKKM